MSIGKRLVASFLLILVAVVGTALFLIYRTESAVTSSGVHQIRTLVTAHSMQSSVFSASQEAFAYSVSGLKSEKADFYKSLRRFDVEAKRFLDAHKHKARSPEGKRPFASILRTRKALEVNAELMFADASDSDRRVEPPVFNKFEDSVDKLEALLDRQVKTESRESQTVQALALSAIARTRIVLLYLIAGILLLSLTLSYLNTRSISGPLHSLGRTADKIAGGELDASVQVKSKDEIGKLAVALESMRRHLKTSFDQLKSESIEREKATKNLDRSLADLEITSHTTQTIAEMSNRLQSCRTIEEAGTVTATFLTQLLPDKSGAVYLLSDSKHLLETMTVWGPSPPSNDVFAPDDCWALRQARTYIEAGDKPALLCPHLHSEVAAGFICIPLMTQSEMLGLMTVKGSRIGDSGELVEADEQLAQRTSENLALALANLKLRDLLRDQSIRDPLTSLFNRRYMEESFEREMSRAVRAKSQISVIMIDIDRFKQFNDSYGHAAGDALLRELGAFLTKQAREADIACRYGGEEFVLILPDVSMEKAGERAKSIANQLRDITITSSGKELPSPTLSFGIAAFPAHGETLYGVLKSADSALYEAKDQGRDRVRFAASPPKAA